MATRRDLILAIIERYVSARRSDRTKVLDEFVALTGRHRKHAMRLLRSAARPPGMGSRPGRWVV
jgi:hypothetical protein